MSGDTPLFNKRHYEETARLFGQLRPDPLADKDGYAQWEGTVREFCKMMLLDNPAFDLKRYLTAVKNAPKPKG